MKTLLLSFLCFALISPVVAQSQNSIPKQEFIISLSHDVVELKTGETKDITVSFAKSKSFSKSKATLGLSSTLPAGVSLLFEPASGVLDSSIAHLAIDGNGKPGSYTIIINGTINHKNKGTTLKLVIKDPSDFSVGLK